MTALFWALVGSKWIRRLGLCFAAVAAYAIWEGSAENRGADRALIAVERQSNADTEVSHEVRTDVAGGKRGKSDPNRLRAVPTARADRAGN